MLQYSTLADSDLNEITQAWNRCWQGYLFEMNYSEAQMKAWLHQCQVDLSHSVAIRESEKIVGFALLSVEKEGGWIAGTSIDPFFRGQHLFLPLMTTQIQYARDLGLKQLKLEVLTQNHAARVYEAVGFKQMRELYVYRFPKGTIKADLFPTGRRYFREVPLADYFEARIRAEFSPAWQRRENYLRRYPTLKAWLNFNGTAGMLFTGEGFTTLLDAWTNSWEQAEKLVFSILEVTDGNFNLTNQPKDWLSAYLTQLGISPITIQNEMIFFGEQTR